MWIYFRRRIVDAVLVIGAVGTLSFVMLHVAPGDPVAAALTDARVSASVRAHWRSVYGFDRPVLEQYGRYVASLARLDPGYSFSQHRPVSAALREALPRSILLMGLALAASVLSGVALGVWQAAHMGSWRQRTIAGALSVVAAIPDVWLALMLLTIFGAQLAWFPLNGLCDPRACSDAIGWPAFVDRDRKSVV